MGTEDDPENRVGPGDVVRELPGTWGGSSLSLSQYRDGEWRLQRLVAPGTAMGPVKQGAPFRWHLVKQKDGEFTGSEITLTQAVELLPEEWQDWPERIHRNLLKILQGGGGTEKDPRISYLTEQLETVASSATGPKADREPGGFTLLGDIPDRLSGTSFVLRPDNRDEGVHEFGLAAAESGPVLGSDIGHEPWRLEIRPRPGESFGEAIELRISLEQDRAVVSRLDGQEDLPVRVGGSQIDCGEMQVLRFGEDIAATPGERLGVVLERTVAVKLPGDQNP